MFPPIKDETCANYFFRLIKYLEAFELTEEDLEYEKKKGCGKDIGYPEVKCGDLFSNKIYLCEECEKK